MCWKRGMIDSRGNMIISPSYPNWPLAVPAKTYIVCTSGCGSRKCVIDEEGRIVVPIQSLGGAYRIYDRQIERFGLYSSSGEELLPFEFDFMNIWDTLDYIAVCKGGEWYYVNQHGERVLL